MILINHSSLTKTKKIMNKEFPLNTLTFNGQKFGLSWTIDFPVFFTKFKEMSGVDIKPLVASIMLRLIRSEIKNLEQGQELKCLTKEGELDLKNYQDQATKLAAWLKATNHE